MAKKMAHRLAEDIRASLHEALDYAAGRRTKAVIHQVNPRASVAREGRLKLLLRRKRPSRQAKP